MDKSLAICKVCRTAIKYSDSTTNLKTHMVRRHGEKSVDANVSNVTANTSKNTEDNNMALKDFSSHNLATTKVITASIARFIAKDLRPYSVVENDGF